MTIQNPPDPSDPDLPPAIDEPPDPLPEPPAYEPVWAPGADDPPMRLPRDNPDVETEI